jgi:UDP-glucose 4-epimerase
VKILITGNLGFVGGATEKLLTEAGHQVIGFDVMENKDIRDVAQLEKCVQETQPDRILHLAAIARFSEADKDPKLAFETNAMGTMNVARVAQKYHVPVVYSSTGSAIMPLNDYTPPFDESIPARGNSIYGSTKAFGEMYIRESKPFIILRYGHLYGAEKRMHGAISGFLDRMQRGLAPVLYGGQQTNSFIYIKDIARANVLALTANWDCWNQIYNIGSSEELTTEFVFNTIKKMMGYKGKIEKKEQRTVDPSRFAFDVSKADRMLNFKPQWKFEAGLKDMLTEMNLLHGKK